VSRRVVVIIALGVSAVSAATTVFFVTIERTKPAMTEEQKATREKFFGTSKELPPIKDGQEMRPRW
jgi:type IV secretion system protein TrbK